MVPASSTVVAVRFVVVAFVDVRFVSIAVVALTFVEVTFVDVRFVSTAVVALRFVDVRFTVVSPPIMPLIATTSVALRDGA
jgi:hypothetical protein